MWRSSRLWITVVLGLAGITRLIQFAADSSLHLDEAALARNIADRGFGDLVAQPLDYDQVAPAFFLLLEKSATLLFGDSEFSLRLLPLLAALALIPVFFLLARRFLPRQIVPAACLMFAFAYSFVSYAAAAKQYSSDMLAATALVLLAHSFSRQGFDDGLGFKVALAGVPLVLISFPAVPIAAFLGAWLLVVRQRRKEPQPIAGLLTVLAAWGVSAAVAAGLALRGADPSTREYMNDFWHSGFVPWGDSWFSLVRWLPEQALSVFDILLFPQAPGHWVEMALLWLCVVLAGLGIVSVSKRHGLDAIALLAPLIVAVALASVHLLPFRDRAGLYAAPVLVLLVIEGAASLGHLGRLARQGGGPGHRKRSAITAVAVASACTVPVLLHPLPWTSQPIRPVLEQVADDVESGGGSVYAFYGAGQAFAWYAPRIGLDDWVQGACHRGDVRAYFRQLDDFRGGVVWVVFTHARERFDEVGPMLAYLRTIGIETAGIEDPDGNQGAEAAFAYRFDLTDPARLAATTAEDFAETGSFVGSPALACTGPAANF